MSEINNSPAQLAADALLAPMRDALVLAYERGAADSLKRLLSAAGVGARPDVAAPLMRHMTIREGIKAALADGPKSKAHIIAATGRTPGTISVELCRMSKAGRIRRSGRATYALPTQVQS